MAKISFVILGFLILQLALIQAKRFSKLTHTEVTQSDPFSVATNVLAQYTSAEGWGSFYETPIILADIDGNGLEDIVGFGPNSLLVSFAAGDGTYSTPFSTVGGLGGTGWNFEQNPVTSCDVNGDGYDDLVGFGYSNVFVAFSNGSSFEFAVELTSSFLQGSGWSTFDSNPRFCYDVNGDKLADLVGFANDGVYVQFSTGSSFSPAVLLLSDLSSNYGWTSFNQTPRCLAHVTNLNQPNLGADILAFNSSGVYLSNYNNGVFGTPTLILPGLYGSSQFPVIACVDMDGDGLTDIIGFGSSTLITYSQVGGGYGPTNALVQETSGQFTTAAPYNTKVAGRTQSNSILGSFIGFANDGIYVSNKLTSNIPSSVQSLYTQWKANFSQSFGSLDTYRQQVFYQNYIIVTAQLALSQSYQMGYTQFMTLTAQEFKNIYLAANPNFANSNSFVEKQKFENFAETERHSKKPLTLQPSQPKKFNPSFMGMDEKLTQTNNALPTTGLPTSWDWRTKGAVTPIKNQGNCGSCWAFSTTGALEGLYFISGRGLQSFSEQQLVDCSGSYGNGGCNGGWMNSAFQYVMANGIQTESQYPYIDLNSPITEACKATCGFYKIGGYNNVPVNSDIQLQAAVHQQPVSIAVDASNWYLYSSGILPASACTTSIDHGVLVVGYTPTYWIVKNQWGTGFGMNGYIYLARPTDTCGDLLYASYPTP